MAGAGGALNREYVIMSAPGPCTNLGYQRLDSITTDNQGSLTVPAGAKWALMVAETQAIRWRDDGTLPTATVGMPLAVAVQFQYTGNLAAFRVIGQIQPAKLHVTYYA